MFLVIASLLWGQLETLMYGLIGFLSRHVQKICKSCFDQIRNLKHLKGYLTHHAAVIAENALVKS